MTTELNDKTRDVMGPLAIDKRRLPSSGLSRMGIPAFVAEWVLDEIVPGSGPLTETEVLELGGFADRMIPKRNEQNVYRHRLQRGERVAVLASMNVEVEIKRERQTRVAKILALGFSDCWISDTLVEQHPGLLKQGMWGVIELVGGSSGVEIISFHPMQADVNLEQFYGKRSAFSASEWRELLLNTCGYNPNAYTAEQQIWILCRLLPVVEKHMHLMELAPKGTGKSYIYENISPRVYLTSGNVTPAVLFVNNATGQEGILARYDAVVLDEVQTIRLEYPEEVVANLKIFLANGIIRRGGKSEIGSDCGFVLLANIRLSDRQEPDSDLVVRELPSFLREPAFLDRIAGIIPGWKIPKFRDECVATGLGLKADFFADALAAMRLDGRHEDWVRRHVSFPNATSIRDQKAIRASAAGLLKLLYPNLDVSLESFNNFCLQPAVELRQLVRNQLWQLDAEFRQNDRQLVAVAQEPTE